VRPAPPQEGRLCGRSLPPALTRPAPSNARFFAALALLAGVLALLLLANVGEAPLERAEIYFLDASRTMVETGDLVVPRYQGEPFYDKPVLAYWLMAAAMKVVGAGPGAGRAVSALAAVGVLFATAWLGTLLFSRRTAIASAFVLSTTLAFLSFGRIAMSDVLLALWTTLAVALAVRVFAPSPPPWTAVGLGAVAGLGFATKGPIAAVIPGLALLLLLARHRRVPASVPVLALGTAVFALLGLGWFALVAARMGPQPLVHFFFRENLERFAGEGFDVGRPAWFYLPAFFAEGMPWSPLLPAAVLSLRRGDADPGSRAAGWFLAAWAALVLVPLSLSRGKIDYYLLPLYPAVSLLVGRYLVEVPWRRLDRAWTGACLTAIGGGLAWMLLAPPRVPAAWLPSGAWRIALLAVLAAAVVALLLAAARPTPRRAAAALGVPVVLAWLVLVAGFLPAFAAAQPNRQVAADVARELSYRSDAQVAICGDPSRARRDVLFHARVTAVETCDVWGLAASPMPFLLLVNPAQAASLETLPEWRTIERYSCVPASALTLDGLLSSPQPCEVVLGANFYTADPVADRKRRREYRKGIQQERAQALR
jgi:4-amino-4-deoxy-L-arabinose transferase-like glycosyltransferase